MDPITVTVVVALIFASLFVVDRITDIPKERSRNEEHTKQRLAELAQLKEMTSSAVALLRALHGGAAGEALRTIIPGEVVEERNNGGSAVRYPNSTPPPAGFAGHRAAAAEGR